MNKMSLYRVTKMQNKDKVVLIKNGVFYNAYTEDAVILWFIFRYKVIDKKASFPLAKLDNVITTLNKFDIDVVVVNSESDVSIYASGGIGYDEFLRESGIQFDLESKLDDIMLLAKSKIKRNDSNYDVIIEFLKNL